MVNYLNPRTGHTEKMSKSRGNVVSPAPIVQRFGADTARCYILFMGPPDQDAGWSDDGVEGMHRFLGRLWRTAAEAADELPDEPVPATGDLNADGAAGAAQGPLGDRQGHRTISRAASRSTRRSRRSWSSSTRSRRPSAATRQPGAVRFALATAASLLFPFAPHASARRLPPADRRRACGSSRGRPPIRPSWRRDTFELVCQVNGKVRDRLLAPAAAGEDELIELALAAPNVLAHVDGKQVVKTIVVPGRLVNVVVR